MDLSRYDFRARAEEGMFVALNDPYTGEPIKPGPDAPGFDVRGVASRTVQSRLAEMQKQAAEDAGDDAEAAMERLHSTLIDTAMRYIIRARNIEVDGHDVGSDEAKIRRILDMTFPDLRVVKDENGLPVMVKGRDKEGKEIDVPKFDLFNEPFAQQVIKSAEDGSRFFAGTSSD